MKDLIKIILISLGVIALLTVLVYMDPSDKKAVNDPLMEPKGETIEEMMGTPLTEQELVSSVKEFINIYHQLYYITQDDSPEAQSDTAIIMSFLTEALSDKNKLERLLPKIITLSEHPNLLVRANGMSLLSGVNKLINAQNNFIVFLRGVDPAKANVAEFQFQMSLLGSESKDAFFTIIEGSSSMNMAYLDFGSRTDDMTPLLIGKESQKELLSEIDRLFADIFIEHKQWNKETGFVNAPVSIVEEWRDWISSLGPEKP